MDENSRQAAAKLSILLRTLGIEAEIIDHSHQGGKTSENASSALGEPLERVLKCLLFVPREKDLGRPVIGVIVGGHQRVDVKKLEKISSVRNLRLATAREVLAITGYQVGGVPPVVLSSICTTYIDLEVMSQPYVVGSAGTEFIGMKVNPQEFLKAGFLLADISK